LLFYSIFSGVTRGEKVERTMKKLLITGGSGYLGQHLLPVAAKDFELFATHRGAASSLAAGEPVFLDLTDEVAVPQTIRRIQPDAIIHAAAVNPGRGDADLMAKVNTHGAQLVAQAAVEVGARLVHVSTDVVHDGRTPPYHDDAPPTPLNAYGKSKAAAEKVVLEVCPAAAIARTSLIYGLDVMDRGTAGFMERLERGEELMLFNDVWRQPVWVETLVTALLKLVNLEYSGLLNVVGEQALTREAFGRQMLAYWGIGSMAAISSGRAADISAAIPLDIRMTTDRARQVLHMDLPGVDTVLEIYSGGYCSVK
jgi:dTDP-4-dehydrorhamnose reductase